MFNNISWASYCYAIIILLLVYYSVLAVLYYRNEIGQWTGGKRKLLHPLPSSTTAVQEEEEPNIPVEESQAEPFTAPQRDTPPVQERKEALGQVQELTVRLKEAIAVAGQKQYVKEEFILSLQQVLKRYSFLKGSPYLVAINNLIASECEKHGYLSLSAVEQVMLWNE